MTHVGPQMAVHSDALHTPILYVAGIQLVSEIEAFMALQKSILRAISLPEKDVSLNVGNALKFRDDLIFF